MDTPRKFLLLIIGLIVLIGAAKCVDEFGDQRPRPDPNMADPYPMRP